MKSVHLFVPVLLAPAWAACGSPSGPPTSLPERATAVSGDPREAERQWIEPLVASPDAEIELLKATVVLAHSYLGKPFLERSHAAALEAMVSRARALVHLFRGAADEALSDAHQALVQDPRDARGYFVRAKIYRAQGETTKTLEDTERARGYEEK